MSRIGCWSGIAVFALIAGSLPSASLASDWPMDQHDVARSGVTSEQLATPLHKRWSYLAAHDPAPAWPEPGRELHRTAFDYAYPVIVAGGRVFFGSSADHKVYALDLKTGQTAWEYFTEGPVRFAPAFDAGRLFVAADDGWLHCLEADSGRLLWRFRGGPTGEKMVGNGRVISRWPLRSGVAVRDGIVYVSAGMWPSEGIFVYALRAADGQVVWKNDTCGSQYIQQPHPPSTAVSGVSPQGNICVSSDQLFIPTGRSTPAVFDRHTGELLYYRSRPDTWGDRWGGSWTMLADDLFFNWRSHVGPDIDVQAGEYQPDAKDGLATFAQATGQMQRDFPGQLLAIVRGDTMYTAGSGQISAFGFSAWKDRANTDECTRWQTPHGRVYAMILAGNTLVAGGPSSVAALDATSGQMIWQQEVNGQARGLAAADGCLLVSTTAGEIVCFGLPPAAEPDFRTQRKPGLDAQRNAPDSEPSAAARRIVEQSGKTAGYCLVLGAGDGKLLSELAACSQLTIHCVEPDAERVRAVRSWLDELGIYGTRVVVHHGSLSDVACPELFADLVLVTAAALAAPDAWPAEEAYRAVHPLGGILCPLVEGFDATAAFQTWLAGAPIPAAEIVTSVQPMRVVRGPLAGADDWTHQYANAQRSGSSSDAHVRMPLRLLWFGEPGPEQMVSRHWKGPAPLCVDGRLFVIGQHTIMSVDAYNGRPLWRRELKGAGRWPVNSKGSNVVADRYGLYVAVGNTCHQLDPHTGQTARTYAIPPDALPADQPAAQWSYLAVADDRILGSAGNDQEAATVFLLNRDGQLQWSYKALGVVGNNALAIDDNRVYLIDRSPAAWVEQSRRRGQTVPVTWKLVALEAATGRTAWETTTGIVGSSELWLSGGVLLTTGGGRMSGYDAASGKCLYEGASEMQKFPVIVGDTIYGEPVAYDLHTGAPRMRSNPFTGQETPWVFSRTYGCGSVSGCPNLLMFRSGNLGLYDLSGDSGVQDIGGVRAGCHVNAIAAAGLVLMPPGDAACTCSYAFQTTIALAPTRTEENWGLFYKQLPSTAVRRLALNLGAPGDRRSRDGTLWLATPRPASDARRRDIAVPFRFDQQESLKTFRQNADLTPIQDTDRPWLYTSGVRGPLRAELDLEIFDRGATAWPLSEDGLDQDRFKAVPVSGHDAAVVLRYDDSHLYLRLQRSADVMAGGLPVAWRQATDGQDADVWQDDCLDVKLSNTPVKRDQPSPRCLHLGVSASGARYDGLWQYVTPTLPLRDVPRLDATVDADPADWTDKGFAVRSLPGRGGKLLPARDFDPGLRLGWNAQGLLILAEIQDSVLYDPPENEPITSGDSIELYVTPQRGSAQHYGVLIAVAAGGPPRVAYVDRRTGAARQPLDAQVAGKTTSDGYLLEILLPWKNLGLTPDVGSQVGLQVFVNDSDRPDDRTRVEAMWHPAGNPAQDALAYQELRLAEAASEPLVFQRGETRDDQGFHTAVAPADVPTVLPAMGAQGEDRAFSCTWSATVQAEPQQLAIELAIPWKTIDDAGLDRSQLMVSLDQAGVLTQPPMLGQGFERLIVVPGAAAQRRTLNVRLHFAELEAAQAGQRVFDVKLQGQTVLAGFDIAQAAGGTNRAVTREFANVTAARALVVELVPASASSPLEPTLCAIEFTDATP